MLLLSQLYGNGLKSNVKYIIFICCTDQWIFYISLNVIGLQLTRDDGDDVHKLEISKNITSSKKFFTCQGFFREIFKREGGGGVANMM